MGPGGNSVLIWDQGAALGCLKAASSLSSCSFHSGFPFPVPGKPLVLLFFVFVYLFWFGWKWMDFMDSDQGCKYNILLQVPTFQLKCAFFFFFFGILWLCLQLLGCWKVFPFERRKTTFWWELLGKTQIYGPRCCRDKSSQRSSEQSLFLCVINVAPQNKRAFSRVVCALCGSFLLTFTSFLPSANSQPLFFLRFYFSSIAIQIFHLPRAYPFVWMTNLLFL